MGIPLEENDVSLIHGLHSPSESHRLPSILGLIWDRNGSEDRSITLFCAYVSSFVTFFFLGALQLSISLCKCSELYLTACLLCGLGVEIYFINLLQNCSELHQSAI